MNAGSAPHHHEEPEETIRLLQDELAQTNREVMALTLELEKRVDELEKANLSAVSLVSQLRSAEQRYRRLAENAPDVILRYELQPNRGFTYVNPKVEPVTGYTPEELYNDPELGFKIVHPDDRQLLDAVIRGATPADSISTLRLVHKKGHVVWIEQHHALVNDREGNLSAIECIARDISERKQLEEQFRQAQKMEAVGRLAGGIAHDFNNLLTVINGYSALVLESLGEDDPTFNEISEVHKAGERAAGLTRQLLAFSRRQVFTLQVLDLNSVVTDIQRMLRRVLGEDIELSTALEQPLDSVQADRGQIEQVIMNLAVNARDAMPEGGQLLIETSNVELDAAYAAQHREVTPGPYVMLAVSDTGHGMDAQTQARIFEPFFTTKPQGQGTGLGLSTVYGIVKQSGGTIWVYSELGHGTTFKVYLPRVNARPVVADPRAASRPISGSGTVLVVEDEDGVRALIHMVLRQAGYTVLEARSGEEALRRCEAHTQGIDLVITDVVMPQMGGRELANRLAVRWPGIKLLFMSGYTDNAIVQQVGLDAETPFLQKPFTPAALAGKVRLILRGEK
jgi:PAS domain S-box-containing protein